MMGSAGDLHTPTGFRGPEAFGELVKRERESVRIFFNEPFFVPGLFQVRAYATEVIARMTGLKLDSAELGERVQQRLERAGAFAERLRGAGRPRVERVAVVLDEGSLRRVIGGPQAAREQLDHLRELATLDAVELGIIPLSHGAHPGQDVAFEVHEGPGGDTAVFVERVGADELVVNDAGTTERCRELVETLLASAVSGAEAQALLETISTEL